MTLKEHFLTFTSVKLPAQRRPVYQTTIDEINSQLGTTLTVGPDSAGIELLILEDAENGEQLKNRLNAPKDKEWAYLKFGANGNQIIVSQPHLLFSTTCYLLEYQANADIAEYADGKFIETAFKWQRPAFDTVLTQSSRFARNVDFRETIREYAKMGYSHVEVNCPATPHGMEPGVPNEVYTVFYAYGAGLDQFVSSRLNRGIYPAEYLSANLGRMKRYAKEALKYGMKPGMHSFEPRNVSEELLQRYPMLRGGRIDHPFRSLKPRYTLALAHPYTRAHYQELIQNLLKEIPELAYLSLATNDSGAGYEYTRSLYVGSNGGPYLIREWKTVDEVAQAAAKNTMSFLHLLRDSAAEINPDFRVMIRMEPFGQERPHMLPKLGNGVDVEGASFVNQGYASAYKHEKYDDVGTVQGTIWQMDFKPEERKFIDFMEKQNGHAHAMYTHGLFYTLEPLVGTPYPKMLYKKLKAMHRAGADYTVMAGGINPPSLAPWNVNNEISRLFQHNPNLDIETSLRQIATRWVGTDLADALLEVWDAVETGLEAYPAIGLYAMWGMAWYRLWLRPIIPNIEKISEADREYYERFMLAPPNNPNRIDLNQDVLFELGTVEGANKAVTRIDDRVVPALIEAQNILNSVIERLPETEPAKKVFIDQRDRIIALVCWMRTMRNVQAWTAGVHGYLHATDATTKTECRVLLKEMVLDEIENSRKLLQLWETTRTEFMVIAQDGESIHLMGDNFGELLARKIELMQGHENDEPFIDPNFIWRVPGLDFYSMKNPGPGASPATGQLGDSI